MFHFNLERRVARCQPGFPIEEMNFDPLIRSQRNRFGAGAPRHVELERPGFKLPHHFAVLAGEPFMELQRQDFALWHSTGQILIAATAFVDHAAGHVHNGVQERMRGTAILGLDVIHGIANAHVRIEPEVHAIGRLLSSRRPRRMTETVDIYFRRN